MFLHTGATRPSTAWRRDVPADVVGDGLNDPRVAYWEPAEVAQVLRHEVANGDELCQMDMSAGHPWRRTATPARAGVRLC